MAFMDVYGHCRNCRQEGALWLHEVGDSKIHLCDECDSLKTANRIAERDALSWAVIRILLGLAVALLAAYRFWS